ncbi:hypothetical protein ACF1AO_22950 [Streptomyces longwoodensis]|uniref:hypothetical protein n=1 Tax=Streptomyces longwoodensis TaxID=68231 RepID=UPI0037026239
MDTSAFLAFGHLAGMFVGMWTFKARAGGSFWYGVPTRVMLISPEWTLVSLGKALLWEVTLVLWLVNGKPASPWGVPVDSRSGRIVRLAQVRSGTR